jgi:chondroitin 4-sulfotransferase 11
MGAQMLINATRKFIFVHVQKTAGLSVERALLESVPGTIQWHGRHGRVVDGLGEMSRDEWARHFSFAFVRNPWERLVSWYAMIDAARNALSAEALAQDGPLPSDLWNYAIANSRDFESFLRNCTDTLFDLGCNKSFAFNQVDYLSDERGEIVVDFIGRFENLESDMDRVYSALEMERVELPRLNASTHSHYSHWYTQETRQLVAERFSRDIAAFGYRFQAG